MAVVETVDVEVLEYQKCRGREDCLALRVHRVQCWSMWESLESHLEVEAVVVGLELHCSHCHRNQRTGTPAMVHP